MSGLDSTEKRLRQLLQQDDPQKVIDLFSQLEEVDREKLKPICVENFRKTNERIRIDAIKSRPNPLWPTAQVAYLCVANFSEVKKQGWIHLPDEKWVGLVFRFRKPEWSPRFVDWILNNSHQWVFWDKARAVVREGVCPKPDDPQYYTGMIAGLQKQELGEPSKSVYAKLKADPELLNDEVWKLFEYEGAPDNSLPYVDSCSNWSGSLLRLCHEGMLPRERLMNSSLSALELGWNQPRSKWMTNFYDLLEPKTSELYAELQTLLGLLASPTPVTATWAFGHVCSVVDEGLVKELNPVIEAMRPLLRAKPKKTVLQTLKFFGRIAKNNQALTGEICLMATEALAHEKADVQQNAFELIEKWGASSDQDLTHSVEEMEPLLAASLKKRFDRGWKKTVRRKTRRRARPPFKRKIQGIAKWTFNCRSPISLRTVSEYPF